MDQRERDEILYRLDERTKKVDDHLKRLDRRVGEVEDIVDTNDDRITANEGTIEALMKAGGGIGSLIIATVSAYAAKLAGLLHF